MNYKFSKLAKTIIIINVILTLLILSIHIYNTHRMIVSNEKIAVFMEEKKVIRSSAIRMLRQEGVDLFIDEEFTTYFGIFISIVSLILSYIYAKNNTFFSSFALATSSLFTSFIGGFLLFYVILSGKSEIESNNNKHGLRNNWERFIHEKGHQ